MVEGLGAEAKLENVGDNLKLHRNAESGSPDRLPVDLTYDQVHPDRPSATIAAVMLVTRAG